MPWIYKSVFLASHPTGFFSHISRYWGSGNPRKLCQLVVSCHSSGRNMGLMCGRNWTWRIINIFLWTNWCCWWTKSCITKDDDYPIIYRILTIPGGAGFLNHQQQVGQPNLLGFWFAGCTEKNVLVSYAVRHGFLWVRPVMCQKRLFWLLQLVTSREPRKIKGEY